MTTGVGEVRMGTTAGDLTAIPGVSEKIERSSGHVTAVSDLADVAVTTGVSEHRTETSACGVKTVSDLGDIEVASCVGEVGGGGAKSAGDVTAMSDVGVVSVTALVGEEGMGKSAGDVAAMSGTSKKRTETNAGDVTAV